jgi:energy-coupling factor transporter ATP-binding protein EcfA2
MLKEIELDNYRRFEQHKIPFRRTTVIVGRNNAGKSTIVEALRLTSLAANRYRSLRFVPPPSWLEDPAAPSGVTPSLRDLNTSLQTVFHAYSDPPAVVRAKFTSGDSIAVYVGPDEHVFAVVRGATGKPIRSKAQATTVGIEGIAVQPQVGPVQPRERLLDIKTVTRGLDSPLAPLHFRNQLHHLGEEAFEHFRELTEETWPSLQIRDFVIPRGPDEVIQLFIREGKHVGELAMMGHGLQMWLQVMWFLARNREAPTIVLDEPDVYMHADLQRRLMRLLRRRHQQVVVATHSIEILSEVAPEDVLVVTSELPASRWANSAKAVQRVIDNIGGVHNIHLARLSQARRCLFVEGRDLSILRSIWDILFPHADALDTIPHMAVGGWSGWPKVDASAQFLRNAAGDLVTCYSVFDSDCHVPAEIIDRYDRASGTNVRMHVLLRKEIENYLLVPGAFARLILERKKSVNSATLEAEVERALDNLCAAHMESVVEDFTTQYNDLNKGTVSAGKAAAWAKRHVAARVQEPNGLRAVVPGKAVLKAMLSWVKTQYGVGLNAPVVARALAVNEIDEEMRDLLTAIYATAPIPLRHLDVWRERNKG